MAVLWKSKPSFRFWSRRMYNFFQLSRIKKEIYLQNLKLLAKLFSTSGNKRNSSLSWSLSSSVYCASWLFIWDLPNFLLNFTIFHSKLNLKGVTSFEETSTNYFKLTINVDIEWNWLVLKCIFRVSWMIKSIPTISIPIS